MKKILLVLVCFIPFLSFSQSCENANSLFLEKGRELAYQVMKKISPNTGKNLYLTIDSYTPTPKYSSKINKCWQSVFIDWTANKCAFCSENLSCKVSGYVMYNYNTKSFEFEIEEVNDAIKDIESWNKNLTIGSIVAITGAVIYASSGSSNSKSSYNSSSNNSSNSNSSNSYSNSSSSSYSKSTCSSCNGRGICTECAGKGSYYCSWCKGKGTKLNFLIEEKCSWCNGTGVKYCTNCNGKGVCRSCNGKGEY